jgi:hypothetical protein
VSFCYLCPFPLCFFGCFWAPSSIIFFLHYNGKKVIDSWWFEAGLAWWNINFLASNYFLLKSSWLQKPWYQNQTTIIPYC